MVITVDVAVILGTATVVIAVIGLVAAVYLRLGKMEARIDGLETKMDALASDMRDMRQEIRREFDRALDAIAHHEHRDDGTVMLVLGTTIIPAPGDD